MPVPRAVRVACGGWLFLAFVVWNGFFDILVTRGEKQYLLAQARHELGIGPAVTMHEIMVRTIHDAARVATVWAMLVAAVGAATTWWVYRAARRQAR